jgi:hypothetical protein
MAPGHAFQGTAQILAAVAACALLGGCIHSHRQGGHHPGEVHAAHDHGGPPPWAPAHGQRRKHDAAHDHGGDAGGVKVVFDSERGVYVVIGFPYHYYDAGHYYRVSDGRWHASAVFEGPWVEIETTLVPEPLRRASKKPEKPKKAKKAGSTARWSPYWD